MTGVPCEILVTLPEAGRIPVSRDEYPLVLPVGLPQNMAMSPLVPVHFHPSQFPEAVRQDLLESLRTRKINHKFHYDSVKQAHKWLALHQAYSPARTDPDCGATYDRAFAETVRRIDAGQVHLVSLGCGGGEKDSRLLGMLRTAAKTASYLAVDVSAAMVLIARQTALAVIGEQHCAAAVCDLATTTDLEPVLRQFDTANARLIACFGMIPNFEPQLILSRLSVLLRPADYLLLSANLAPGSDYAEGMRRILPLYDNELTADWLMTWLNDLGIGAQDGRIRFTIEEHAGLNRVEARFEFSRDCRLTIDPEGFEFVAGDIIRLFFSYRYTPTRLKAWLAEYSLHVVDQWISRSEEEGVFLISSKHT